MRRSLKVKILSIKKKGAEPFSEAVTVILFFGPVPVEFQDGGEYFGSVRFWLKESFMV